jgi:hypothetical protein
VRSLSVSANSVLLGRLFFVVFLLIAFPFVTRSEQAGLAQPWTGAPVIRETNSHLMARAKLADEQPPKPHHMIVRHHRGAREDRIEFPILITSNFPAATQPTPPLASQSGPFGTNGTALAFTGATLADCNAYPPDTMGAVGPSQFIVAVNGRIRSFNKTNGLADGVLNSSMDSFFNSVMTPPVNNNFTSDPRIRYDRLSRRWFVIIIDVPGTQGSLPNRILIAVSDSSVVTPSTVWSFYYFEQDLVSPTGDTGSFADYPTLGIDANALYIGVNIFSSTGSFANTTAFVVRKSSLLSGGPIAVTAFRQLISGPGHKAAGPYTPQGVDNFDPAATEGYIIGIDAISSSKLQLRRVSNPGGTPSLSGNVTINVSTFASPITVPSLGSSVSLDGLDARLLAAHYRNGFLWTTHNVGVSDAGSSSGVTRDGVRWYQIAGIPTGQTPSVQQTGTIYDPSTTNRSYWMGTVMVSGQGHAVLGFSSASSSEYVNCAVSGRLANDAANTVSPPIFYTASSASYNPPYNRWGDYSYTSLDPNDDMTLWTIQEFVNAVNSYAVQIAKLLAPPPAVPTNCSPSAVLLGASSVNLSLTGLPVNGAGFFDPGPGFSNHLAAAISGGGVTVNSVTFNNPTNLTLNVSVATNAALGPRPIVVTNPDGQSVTNSSLLAIVANNAPVLAAISNQTILELTTLTFTNSATDPNTNGLTFSMLNAPAGATLDPNTGIFSWTPTEAQGPSTNTLSIVVTDSGSPPLSATQTFTIFVLESNSPPSLAAIPNYTIFEMQTLAFTNFATDADIPANVLTFSMFNAPAGALLDPNTGIFSWTPTEAQGPGTNIISIVVTDNGSPALSATQTFTIFVLETNSPPTLAAISNYTIFATQTLTFTNAASDPDIPANTLTFSMLNAPTNATLDPASGVFSWTPTTAQAPSTNGISIVVTDNGSPALSATQTFSVFVLPTNIAPVLAAISNYTIFENQTVAFTNSASDPDGDTLSFSMLNAPTNAALDPANGVFSWTPTTEQAPSTNEISIVVTDNGSPSLSATQTFSVFVLPTNTAPVLAAIPDRTIHAGTTLTFTNSATDSDVPTNTLTFNLDVGASTGATLDSASGVFTWAPSDSFAGTTNNFTISVTDNGTPPLSDSKSFNVIVVSRPTIESIVVSNEIVNLTWSAIAGQSYRVQFTTNLLEANWNDVPGDILANDSSASATNSAADEQQFYRVRVLP